MEDHDVLPQQEIEVAAVGESDQASAVISQKSAVGSAMKVIAQAKNSVKPIMHGMLATTYVYFCYSFS